MGMTTDHPADAPPRTKRDIVEELKRRGCKTSYRTKEEARQSLENLSWFRAFPWHTEQSEVIEAFDLMDWDELVVQGIFGNGKTTLMLGLFFRLWYERLAVMDDMVMCAFNICIKNELIRRLRTAGIRKRPMIRTFDSIVYAACHALGCPYLDKPNYEGRRRFLEDRLMTRPEDLAIDGLSDRQWLFIDESQDLDGRCYALLRAMFPRARLVVFGDVFQCIQKEPRACLLWRLLNIEGDRDGRRRRVFWMKQTPRVPAPILEEMKRALSGHYPDQAALFRQWVSLNPVQTPETRIRWKSFRSYRQVFAESLEYIRNHGITKVMVLVFSSAITVRGGLGDVARFRHFYQSQGIAVNSNYKRLETDRLFLSTVNSSKGLEREYVFLVLTFPLELAFANFSNDLVMNLVSVGLSRCRRQVVFYVPSYKDRESLVTQRYEACPRARDENPTFAVRKGMRESFAPPPHPNIVASAPEQSRFEAMGKNPAVFLEQPHSTTEILRQGIVSYTVRLECLEHVRQLRETVCLPSLPIEPLTAWRKRLSRLVQHEEQRALLGTIMEHLLCCAWKTDWPPSASLGVPDDNPLAAHCRAVFLRLSREYFALVRGAVYTASPPDRIVRAVYLYSRCMLMAHNRVAVSFPDETLQAVTEWYRTTAPSIRSGIPPHASDIRLQHHLRMPCATGIADGYLPSAPAVPPAVGRRDTILYEIKGCTLSGWHEDALFQAFLYLVMAGRSTGTIVLLNPVRNERREYAVRIPRFYTLRCTLLREILLWNTNCYLAKISTTTDRRDRHRPTILIVEDPAVGSSVFEWAASTSARLVFHGVMPASDAPEASMRENAQSQETEETIRAQLANVRRWFGNSHTVVDIPVRPDRTLLYPGNPQTVHYFLNEMRYTSVDPAVYSPNLMDPFTIGCILLMYMSVAGTPAN